MDEKLQPIAGALIDIWQANKHGRYHHEDDPNPAPLDTNFQGWGQIKSDAQGRYVFKTVIPGAYPVSQSWWRPPHIHFKVSMRGFHELTTQMYFSGHALNSKDRILQGIPDSERDKVIVEFIQGTKGDDPGSKRGQFDIVLCSVKKRQG
jgi:protocatechuate 3,4-dioxygenase beta subunit